MLRNMVTSLFEHERIVTTDTKAKVVGPMAEKLITLAKRGDLHAIRQALTLLQSKEVARKLFGEIKERYLNRTGGYTSIVKLGPRRGDAAEMAVIELIKPEDWEKAKKKVAKKKTAKKKPETKAPKAASGKAEDKPAPVKAEEKPAPAAKAEETPAPAPEAAAPAVEAPAPEAEASAAPEASTEPKEGE
jgi:large subunit ribosomal protein L17